MKRLKVSDVLDMLKKDGWQLVNTPAATDSLNILQKRKGYGKWQAK